jgi:hypothetical protein
VKRKSILLEIGSRLDAERDRRKQHGSHPLDSGKYDQWLSYLLGRIAGISITDYSIGMGERLSVPEASERPVGIDGDLPNAMKAKQEFMLQMMVVLLDRLEQ